MSLTLQPPIAWSDTRKALVIAVFGASLAVSLFVAPAIAILLVVVPALFYFLSRPFELLLLMVFLIPFNFVFLLGSIPVAVELLKVFLWIPFLLTRKENDHLRTSKYDRYFAVVAALGILSVFRTSDLPFTLKEVVRFGSDIGIYYLVLNLVDSFEKLHRILRVLVVSTFIVACYGFYQFAIQDYGALFWIVNPRLDTGVAHFRDTFWPWRNRMISVLTSEMEMGHYFNLCLPIGAALWLTDKRERFKSKWLLMTLAIFAGLLLTFTFAAWGALLATATLFVLFFDKKRRLKMIIAEFSGLALVIIASLYGPLQPMVESKLFGTGMASFAFDLFTRLRMWFFAIQTWWAHPFIGVGLGNYQNLSWEVSFGQSVGTSANPGSSPHQFYLYLLVTLGTIGAACVVIVMLGNIHNNLGLRKDAQFGVLALALAFALTANMIGGFGDDSNMFSAHAGYLVWLLLGLSEAIYVLTREAPLQGMSLQSET